MLFFSCYLSQKSLLCSLAYTFWTAYETIMFSACMNPKSGSFIIDLRLTRHSTLVACLTSEREILKTIYFQILDNHMASFDKTFKDLPLRLINATMTVFLAIATNA